MANVCDECHVVMCKWLDVVIHCEACIYFKIGSCGVDYDIEGY